MLFDRGDIRRGVFIVVEGSIELIGISNSQETVLSVLGPGAFTGEVNQLSGRPTPALVRVSPGIRAPPRVSHRELGRRRRIDWLRCVLRYLAPEGFLSRKGHPFTYLDVERDADVQMRLDDFGILATDIPVLICRGELVPAIQATLRRRNASV